MWGILWQAQGGHLHGRIIPTRAGNTDFASRFIEVKRSSRRDRLTRPNSKKRRRVDMTPHLAETLRAVRLYQKKKALKEGRPASEWVFDNGKGEMLGKFKSEVEELDHPQPNATQTQPATLSSRVL